MDLWVLEYRLVNATPEYVFDWFESNQSVYKRLDSQEVYPLEKALLDRQHRLIDLALALYGRSGELAEKIFQHGDQTIKRAVLSGRSVSSSQLVCLQGDSYLAGLIKNFQQGTENARVLLAELLRNQNLADEVLIALYKKLPPFNHLAIDEWLALIALSNDNPRLSKRYRVQISHSDPNWEWYDAQQFNKVFKAAWELFEKLPVTNECAQALYRLANNLVPEWPIGERVQQLIQRWTPQADDRSFILARSTLVKLIPIESDSFTALEQSSDIAMRIGFYRRVPSPTTENVSYWCRDGESFALSACENKAFFEDEAVRRALYLHCLDVESDSGYSDIIRYFFEQEAIHCKPSPE